MFERYRTSVTQFPDRMVTRFDFGCISSLFIAGPHGYSSMAHSASAQESHKRPPDLSGLLLREREGPVGEIFPYLKPRPNGIVETLRISVAQKHSRLECIIGFSVNPASAASRSQASHCEAGFGRGLR